MTPPVRLRFPASVTAVVAVVLALALSGMLVWQIGSQRRAALDLAGLRLVQQAQVLGDRTAHWLEMADLLMVTTAVSLGSPADPSPIATFSRHHTLRDVSLYLPQTEAIQVFDAAGRLIADARRHPPEPVSVAGDDFFRQHSRMGIEFVLDGPRKAASGSWTIPLSRRLSDEDGSFTGVIRVLVAAARISEAYDVEGDREVDRAILLGADGIVCSDTARGAGLAVGRPLDELPDISRVVEAAGQGFSTRFAETDTLIAAVYYLRDFPFRLVAVRDKADVLAQWRRNALAMGATALAVLLVTMLFVLVYTRQERHRAVTEETLRLRERALAASSNGILICESHSPDMPIIYVNPGFETLTGFGAVDVLGRNPLFLDDGEGLREAMAAGREASAVLRNTRKDGGSYWCEVLVSPVFDPSGRVTHSLGVLRDITARREAEEHMRRVNDELAASNTELEEFAYVASHDLQEPLRMVASYVQLLERRYAGQLDQDGHDFIAYAVSGVKRMQQQIIDLLEYSRVTRKGSPLVPTALSDCLGDALADLEAAIGEAEAVVEAGPLPTVDGDRGQLRRLLENLVGNALKYRTAGLPPQVRVSAERTGVDWTVSVEDNGIGIDPQYFERIFVLFQRLHPRERYPGNGLGLAICRKIVERHGGRIWVESREGHGAVFRFTLPVTPDERFEGHCLASAGEQVTRSH